MRCTSSAAETKLYFHRYDYCRLYNLNLMIVVFLFVSSSSSPLSLSLSLSASTTGVVGAFFLQNFSQRQQQQQRTNTINTVLLPELDNLIIASKNGLDTSYDESVKEKMIEISKLRNYDIDQRETLSGSWELIYTTEKEINFFKTWPFADVTSITQKLDLFDTQIINNYINFEGDGLFAVTGAVEAATATAVTITNDNNNEDSDADRKGNKNGDGDGNVEGENYDRVTFEFKSAKIIAWNKELDNLPPIGSGWFDTMYCNGEYALRCDSRQDWSIFRRIE
mmetsp:Transcript_33236/g.37751  ORF Transcript_33236/g.37751 Transcript_33236/m.37751 type:complete len:280 (+) Transcript_33236:75-914(+)